MGSRPSKYALASSATRLVPSRLATCTNSKAGHRASSPYAAGPSHLQDVAHHHVLQHGRHPLHGDAADQGNMVRFEGAANTLHRLPVNLVAAPARSGKGRRAT